MSARHRHQAQADRAWNEFSQTLTQVRRGITHLPASFLYALQCSFKARQLRGRKARLARGTGPTVTASGQVFWAVRDVIFAPSVTSAAKVFQDMKASR